MEVETDTLPDITITKKNEVFVKVHCDDSIAQELSEHFTFKAHNYRFHPKYKARLWDGNIRLFNQRTKTIYHGLAERIIDFGSDHGYTVVAQDEIGVAKEFSVVEAQDFINTINLPNHITPRDYQIDSLLHCIRHGRSLFISPTGSGKSLIIYMLVRYYQQKTLIVVDSINLLNQMHSDFVEYGFNPNDIHLISAGSKKETECRIVVTTWQSAVKMPPEWFNAFKVVIGDEAHRYKATSLKTIMENLTDCPNRFGLTGSLDGSQSNQLTLEGLFGPYKKLKSTKDLMDEGYLSDLEIKSIVLKYSDEERKLISKTTYEEELKFLYSHNRRNIFIENLALSLKGNTLLMFQRVDSHGVPLYDNLKIRSPNPVYYVSGKTEGEDREDIRKIVNEHEDSITVASVGTFSTGVNIPNIHNIILAAPTKSVVRVLQTTGRGLRKTDTKYKCTMFDIADDLQWKRNINHTLKHFSERIKIYAKEEFHYKIYKVALGKG